MRAEPCGRDERGAILLFGLFMALFVTALFYYLVGLGESLLAREQLQNAADAAALSSAVVSARGMNVIVLINWIMAALVAVLVVLRLIDMVLLVLTAIFIALSFVPFAGAAFATLASTTATLERQVATLYDETQAIVFPALEALNDAARAVKVTTPRLARAGAEAVAKEYQPVAAHAFLLPASSALPLEDERFDMLCGRSAGYVGDLAGAWLPGGFRKYVAEALSGMAQEMSNWFCGSSDAGPPSHTRTLRVKYPETELARRCRSEVEAGAATAATSPACAGAEAERLAAKPDVQGRCAAGQDCSPGGPYFRQAALAREQCEPRRHSRRRALVWQEATLERVYVRAGRRWRIEDERLSDVGVRQGKSVPCLSQRELTFAGSSVITELIPLEWQLDPLTPGQPEFVNPVCARALSGLPFRNEGSGKVRVRYRAVMQVFSCEQEVKSTIAAPTDWQSADDGTRRNAQRVLENVPLGAEPFQARAVALGLEDGALERRVSVAAWSGCDDGACPEPLATLAELRGLALAQAEFYFDGAESAPEWMWSMRWRARIKRFRLAEPAHDPSRAPADPDLEKFHGERTPPSVHAACSRAAPHGACAEIEARVLRAAPLLVH